MITLQPAFSIVYACSSLRRRPIGFATAMFSSAARSTMAWRWRVMSEGQGRAREQIAHAQDNICQRGSQRGERQGKTKVTKHAGPTACRGNEITGMLKLRQRYRAVGQHAEIMGGAAIKKNAVRGKQRDLQATQRRNNHVTTSRGAQDTHRNTNRSKSRGWMHAV